jgi:alkylation response protein AidB-like acyl-CoA dehydrogenase
VCAWPIYRFGSDDLRRRVLPALAAGETLGGFGLTEPGSGSDAGSLRTTARRDGDQWVLDGEKAWITNAGWAGYYVIMAKTDADAGSRGVSAFVVAADSPGLVVGEPEAKMGLRASRTAPLILDGCRVGADDVLGEVGQGFKIALATLDYSRLGIAAQSVGIHQRALELAVGYAGERVQFGVPNARHQAIQFQIAQLATELEAARVLTRYAAWREGERDAGRLAAQAKLYASEAANRACYAALQVHGGNGFSDEYEISRLYRDVRVTTLYEGTSEMQRLVTARHLLRE